VSEWTWRIWVLGLRRHPGDPVEYDMGATHYAAWARILGRLYLRLQRVPHHGRFWDEVSR